MSRTIASRSASTGPTVGLLGSGVSLPRSLYVPCASTSRSNLVTSIQPELWVDHASEAVAFYEAAFGARVLHRIGDGDDIVAQLSVGDAAFWVTAASAPTKRFSPKAIDGTTSRTLLVVDNPDEVVAEAVAAGATEVSPVGEEHGWQIGRIVDPFGHEWEIGKPLEAWPPAAR